MSRRKKEYFVIAALIAAELHQAVSVAQSIALTASNARALALRAGQGAAGFRAITDSIDELASVTIRTSKEINQRAMELSRRASESIRADSALSRFKKVSENKDAIPYSSSLDPVISRTSSIKRDAGDAFDRIGASLRTELEYLSRHLRIATVLSAMSLVEASHAGYEFEQSLILIAKNVAEAAESIRDHVARAQSLIHQIH